MKRTSSVILVLVLTLLSIIFASCDVSRDEPHTKAYLTEDSLIASVNGMSIVELTKPTTATTTADTLSSAVMHIKLVDGEFQNLKNDTDVTDQWIYPIENRNLGLRFITKNISPNSVDLYVSGTSVLSGVERFENDVQVNIPIRYIYGRNTSVNVEGDKKAKIKIYASNDRVAFVAGSNKNNVNVSSSSSAGPIFRLVNTSIRWTSDLADSTQSSFIASWFDGVSNMNYNPSSTYVTGSKEFYTSTNINTYSYNNTANPIVPTNGPVYPKVTIPAKALTDGDENGDLECVSYYSYEFTSSTYAYIVNDVTIDGVTELSEVDTLEEKDIVIGLVQGTFNNITSSDVSSYFYNAPQGLKFTLLDGANLQGKNQMTIRVSGTPIAPSTDKISLYIPNAWYNTTSTGSTSKYDMWVDSRNSFYNIKPGDFFSWNLYDIATFSGTSYDITTSTSTYLNVNRNMTKTYDGSDIAFDSQYRLSYGATKEVTFAPGLSRKGYRLKGFVVQEPVTSRTPNITDDKSYIDITKIAYTSDPKSISFTLDEKYKGEPINIFAVWEVDPDSIYWKADSTSITVTKAMIDDANPQESEDAHLSNLVHHDGTALEDTYKQEMSFIVLPGGRIGGTDDSPEYFKWATTYASESATSPISIPSDIAMADIPLTAAVWNVVYKWATADERGENKYTFDLQQSGASPMLAGVLYKRATDTYLSRHSAEDPIVRMTWYNAVIFANAMTEWYNNVVLGSDKEAQWLGVAYTDDSTLNGKVLRDATDATTLNKINPEDWTSQYNDGYKGIKHVADATGFRLPTKAEWQYAAGVYPESDWTSTFRTVSYPQILNSAYVSGLNEAPYKSKDSTNSPNPKLKDYAVWQNLYNKDVDYGTQTVGKYFNADIIRTNGAKPNFVGIYDMSGNVWEWNEDWYQSGSPSYRYISGGSWVSDASYLYVGRASYTPPSYRYSYYGIRFCRALSPKTNQTK